MMRIVRPACLVLLSAALLGFGGDAPTHERLPMQMDFDRCVLKVSDLGNQNVQGRVRLQLLIRQSGAVYAAFVHSEKGVDDRRLERCLTSTAVLWKLPAVSLDYSRAYQLTFIPGGTELDMSDSAYWNGEHFAIQGRASVFMPDINDPPEPAPLNVSAAQETLDLADWATDAEVGLANLEVRRYGEAIAALRRAVERDPGDTLALRGLSVALAESGENVGEGRALAERLVAAAPDSEASHEALLRVCLVAGGDPCTFREFMAARNAPDVAPRSRILADLQPKAQEAAARLRALASAPDRCVQEATDQDRALCMVRRCLDAGTTALAGELSGAYRAQPWVAQRVGDTRLLVTRPLVDAKGERREPRWLVKLGEQTLTITPTNDDAKHVTLQHSACAVVPSARVSSRDLGPNGKQPAIHERFEKLVQKQQPAR